MSRDLRIRDLESPDLDALLSLYRHLHAEDDLLPPRDEVERLWDEIVLDPGQIYVGGFVGGTLVSACNAAIVPNLTRGARSYAVVENVVTDAEHRRRGIGSKVLGELLERCWSLRCYKVMLMSGRARAEIHGFYEQLGFDKDAKQAFVITRRLSQ
jgi:GNAT superfamily N-acetyltransferase